MKTKIANLLRRIRFHFGIKVDIGQARYSPQIRIDNKKHNIYDSELVERIAEENSPFVVISSIDRMSDGELKIGRSTKTNIVYMLDYKDRDYTMMFCREEFVRVIGYIPNTIYYKFTEE